jgi:hypothetical protein
MNGNTTQQTLELMKSALAKSSDDISKTVNTGTGLVAFDLQAPSKNLYPVNTPIRNRMPRTGGGTGTATNWRVVQAIVGSGFDAMGWVAEGQRTARMSLTTATKAASYVTLGEEDQVTFEAINAAQTFEDVLATETMRVLQKCMLKEEMAILGGNASLALGTVGTVTTSTSGSGATLPTATYNIICVALTQEGFKNSAVSLAGVATSQTITGADGNTYVLNGGSSMKSASATQAIALGASLFVSVAAVVGAVAYAWYIGVGAGNEVLQAITTINSYAQSVPLTAGTQNATAVTADKSQNAALAYDGLITTAFKAGSFGAIVNTLATGTAGTGTFLTASGKGTCNEVDNLLYQMWNLYQVSPSVLYCNGQELKNLTTRVMTGTSAAPLLQIQVKADDAAMNPYQLVAGGNLAYYFNPFAMGGGIKIPVLIHPNLAPGTIVAYCEDLPMQYKSNNVPNTAEVKLRQEYYQLQWPLRTRAREFGVYCESVLAVYAPFAIGMITNIGNG